MSEITAKPRYWMFQEWRDEQGRYWAAPHYYATASDARRSHSLAVEFLWVVKGMHDPYVSALYASDGTGTVELQQACAPGEDPQRPVQVSSPPAGLGKVSSVVKAEAQRREPGSTPGESTGLPF